MRDRTVWSQVRNRERARVSQEYRETWLMRSLLWECYLTPTRYEVRLFRLIPVYRLRYRNVADVHIIDGAFNFRALLQLGTHPWNTVSMKNRWRSRWILLE